MSVLDAQGTVGNIFQLTYNPGNYTTGHFQFYQNVEFARATSSAVNSGSGYYWSHDFRNCRFTDCRSSSGGRGIYHKGDYQRTRSLVMLHDCVFSGNGLTDGAGVAWDGAGVYLHFGRLRAFNCRFEENGLSPTAAPAGNGGKTVNGAAIMARYAGLNVKDTVFVHNRSSAGAAVYGYETSGGYTLDRCAFIGNESVAAASTASGSSAGLALNLASETSPVHVRNCTFAYNIADDATGAAALTVQCGTANVTNCIFSGNIVGASCTVGADVALKSTGYLNMDYCLATDEGTVTATDALRLALGSNMVYGDARFVTSEATVKGWVVSSGGNVGIPVSDRYVYFDPAYAEAIKGIDVHLLSSAGYRKNGDATWHTDAGVSSPAIDAGDPASDYANEPKPNGHRVNLGFYGNTPYASMTPAKGSLIFFK